MRREWTPEETNILLSEPPSYGSFTRVAQRLGRSLVSVQMMARRLGIAKHPPVNQHFFDTWSPTMAYCLGYIWADGSIDGRLKLRCTESDADVIYKIMEAMESKHTVTTRPAQRTVVVKNGKPCVINSRRLVCVGIGGKQLIQRLAELGVSRNKSANKDMSFPSIPDAYLADFCHGVFDGDGTVSTHSTGIKTQVTFYSASRRFLNGLGEQVCRVYGIRHSKVMRNRGIWKTGWTARRDVTRWYRLFYGGTRRIWLDRKYQKWTALMDRDYGKTMALPIFVEPAKT